MVSFHLKYSVTHILYEGIKMAACLRHVRLCSKDLRKLASCQTLNISIEKSSKQLHTCPRSKRFLPVFRSKNIKWSSCLLEKNHVICGVTLARNNSTSQNVRQGAIPSTDYIPEPPPLPEAPQIIDTLNAIGEPTLQSVGLGAWTPSGIVQQGLDWLHVGLDIPWWAAVVAGTVFVRILMFPLVIKSQQNAAHMHNHMPTMTRLQERFSEARSSGDPMAAAKAGHELMGYMQRHQIKPFKNFLVPLAQLPVFVSVFVGLRQMANLPVESMKHGGLFWFTDLTVPDPIYALPLLTMATFLLTIELGVDGVKAGTMSHTMKWVMRGMPIIMMPLISNFPAAMLCYWFTSNTFSLVQVLFLKIPAIRQFFKIEALVKHDTSALPKKKKFVQGFKESWDNAKVANQMEERQRLDALRFKKAGEGPLQKTYTYDPTKVKTINPSKVTDIKSSISAKPKS